VKGSRRGISADSDGRKQRVEGWSQFGNRFGGQWERGPKPTKVCVVLMRWVVDVAWRSQDKRTANGPSFFTFEAREKDLFEHVLDIVKAGQRTLDAIATWTVFGSGPAIEDLPDDRIFYHRGRSPLI
jgi:hypothetical protein